MGLGAHPFGLAFQCPVLYRVRLPAQAHTSPCARHREKSPGTLLKNVLYRSAQLSLFKQVCQVGFQPRDPELGLAERRAPVYVPAFGPDDFLEFDWGSGRFCLTPTAYVKDIIDPRLRWIVEKNPIEAMKSGGSGRFFSQSIPQATFNQKYGAYFHPSARRCRHGCWRGSYNQNRE
ncbi:hypothetical protein FA13DRAFT_819396 [Coprinellus micaceus]|uniref:Uncharacterized protein n=1 Tax=Coprinellus micaceus TaxID=71717 RepID=A0A4Y7S4A8_COPMI|nr:hypothetical protein FA13DRAFT_819396 [Coprinellus micaceus]